MTLSASAAGVYAKREADRVATESLITRFTQKLGAALDDEDWGEIMLIANEILETMPDDNITEVIRWKARFALRVKLDRESQAHRAR